MLNMLKKRKTASLKPELKTLSFDIDYVRVSTMIRYQHSDTFASLQAEIQHVTALIHSHYENSQHWERELRRLYSQVQYCDEGKWLKIPHNDALGKQITRVWSFIQIEGEPYLRLKDQLADLKKRLSLQLVMQARVHSAGSDIASLVALHM